MFQFSAAGPRDEVLGYLSGFAITDPMGGRIRDQVSAIIAAGPAHMHYTVSVFGHIDPGTPLALSIELSTNDGPGKATAL